MKYKSILIAGMALLISSSVLQAESVAPKGTSDRVEWQVQSSWKTDSKPRDLVHSLDGKMVFILDDQHRVLVYNNKGELQGRIPVGDGVIGIDIAPQGESLYLIDENNETFTSLAMSYVSEIDITGSPFKGKADAPVTIAIFTDFE
jgi:DNA-binding beta-propeller fold protein YncE